MLSKKEKDQKKDIGAYCIRYGKSREIVGRLRDLFQFLDIKRDMIIVSKVIEECDMKHFLFRSNRRSDLVKGKY